MKKFLTIVSVLAIGSGLVAGEESQAWKIPFFSKKEAQVVEVVEEAPVVEKQTLVKKITSLPSKAVKSANNFVANNPGKAIVATVVATLVFEQVAAYVYNNFVASNDVEEDEDDLDIV